MSKLAALPGVRIDIKTMIGLATEQLGEMTEAIVIAWDKDDHIFLQHCCTREGLAYAGAMLTHIAVTEGVE